MMTTIGNNYSSSTLLPGTFGLINGTGLSGIGNSSCLVEEEGPSVSDLDELEFMEKKKVVQWIAYRIIGPSIVGIGLLGNVLNLVVLTRPSLKGVTYTYLIGLALSDIGVLLCAVPMMIRQSRFDRLNPWGVTFFYSHLEYPLANSFMASSIFIVISLTVDRFVSVCMPTRFKSLHTTENSRRAMGVACALALLLSAPLSLLNRVCPVSQEEYTFMENFEVTHLTMWRIFIYFEEVVVRFGPALILATLNFLIIYRFRQITERRREMLGGASKNPNADHHHHSHHQHHSHSHSSHHHDNNGGTEQNLLSHEHRVSRKIYKEEKRLVTLLSAIVLLFFVTTTPVAILGISYSERLDKNLYFQIFRAVANVLELCNFALNFYIYFLCSKEFRAKFLSFFTFLLPSNTNNNLNNSPTTVGVTHHEKSRIIMGMNNLARDEEEEEQREEDEV